MSQESWIETCQELNIDYRIRSISGALVSLCVFHTERTPSLFMYPSDTFMCYGCGAHEDIDTFKEQAPPAMERTVYKARADYLAEDLAWRRAYSAAYKASRVEISVPLPQRPDRPWPGLGLLL